MGFYHFIMRCKSRAYLAVQLYQDKEEHKMMMDDLITSFFSYFF